MEVALEVGTFVYRVPKKLNSQVEVGSLVRVPLRDSIVNGWVVNKEQVAKSRDGKAKIEIKNILDICWHIPLITHPLMELGKWMASYYHSSLGAVLNLMVPVITHKLKPSDQYSEPPILYKSKFKSTPPLVIKEAISQKTFKSIVLYGTNRMGIYIQTIDTVLKQNMGVIFLVPEIKLIPEIFSLFQKRFGNLVALLHSGLKISERWAEWLRIREGKTLVVVGTMSAVFAPVHNLGVIIVDEEHDTSYKSEKHPRYFAPSVGKKRAELESCLCICGSATPRIETFYDTEVKKSALIRVVSPEKKRNVYIVDMRKEVDPIFSALLKTKLRHCITNRQKILLYLNRRGFSSFILCEECGYIPKCPNCDIALTYHRSELVLKCHYCKHKRKAVGYCLQCKGTNLSYKGIGTARVEKMFKELFSGINIFRLDLDTASPKYTTRIFNSFVKGEIQVLLGTQLIAKPIEFPRVGLVCVISSDIGLYFPDFRAPERIFSSLMHLIDKGDETIIQTYNTRHPILKYLEVQDYVSFYQLEKLKRKELNYPPYSHLVRILVEDRDISKVNSKMDKVVLQLEKMGINFLGPSPCAFEHKKGKFRVNLLLKVSKPEWQEYSSLLAIPQGCIIDVDPIEFS